MAKKQQTRTYMQSYIPQGGKSKYVSEMALINGLDLRDAPDSRGMIECVNIDVTRLPEVVSVGVAKSVLGKNDNGANIAIEGSIVGTFGYENALFVLSETDGTDGTDGNVTLSKIENGRVTATVSWENANVGELREMVVFCYYPIKIDEMAYETSPEYKLLIYPDRKYIDVGFDDDDGVKVIAPVMEYAEDTQIKHKLEFVVPDDEITLDVTIKNDGTVALASEGVSKEFEGCDIKATFVDVNKKVYVGSTKIKGKHIDSDTFGIFLESVKGSTATLKFIGAKPSDNVDSTFYVTNDSSGDIVYSKDIEIEKGNTHESTITVNNLSKSARYYAYFDYNLSGNNTTRYELYFSLSDDTVDGNLKIDGSLVDDNGSLIKLDISKEYAVSYEVLDGEGRAYVPSNNSSFRLQLDYSESETGNSISPEFQHITVWNSRLFGMKDSVVVCSGAGTPFDWTLDSPESVLESYGITVGGYDETHAWYSTTQANTKASGEVTAITSYDGHPIIFKDDYMHQIYGTSNPFRIQDIVAVGCVSARSVCELDSVLYFASRDGIYRYAGGYPKKISEALANAEFDKDTVCGCYNGVLYVYDHSVDESLIYTYCPANGMWSSIKNPHGTNYIIGFAINDEGLYSVGKEGRIYKYPESVTEGGDSSWHFKTSAILSGTSDDKRVHSISVVAEGEDLDVELSGDNLGGVWNTLIDKDALDGVDKLRALIRNSDSLFHTLRFSGNGAIRIHRVDVTYSVSGRRYK